MPKPTLPTQQQMRDFCRTKYSRYSDLSRQWLQQRMSAAERIATYGYAEVDRAMAEVWETEFFTKTVADQDALLDWLIDWYITEYDGASTSDPDKDDPRYGLGGYVVMRWRDPTVCPCMFQVVGATPGAMPDVWLRTLKVGPEHSLSEQALHDTVYGESSRKSKVLGMIESLISKETREDLTTWVFSNIRLSGSDERVLEVTIAGTTKAQRDDVKAAADIQFGPGTVVIS